MRRSCEDVLLEGSSRPFRLVTHPVQDGSLSWTIGLIFNIPLRRSYHFEYEGSFVFLAKYAMRLY